MSEQTLLNPDPSIRILVVDDHPGTSKTLALALSNLGNNIEAVSATNGYDALKLISGVHVDILITDLMMPGMSGLELFERLQEHPGGRPNYTVLITAYDVPGLKETAKRLKINEIIIKPFGPELLVRMVGEALNRMNCSDLELPIWGRELSTILIADDRPDNVTLLSRYMIAEGYRYIIASDGEEAFRRACQDFPDLILLDVNMPKKNGFEVLAELRANPFTQHIPVIIFTAMRLHPEDVQAGLNLGADDYMTKPFDRQELFARIRTKLRVKKVEDVLRRRNKELSILPEIGKELTARLDLNELGELVLRRMVETLGALIGHMIIINSKNPFHKEYHVNSPHESEVQLPPLNDLVQQIKENRECILVADTTLDTRWRSGVNEKPYSAIIIPVFGRFELIGLFVVIHEGQNYFNADHQILLQAIASQAGIAIENARLYAEVAREQEQMSAVLESAADAIFLFDADSCLLMLNPAAEKLFTGYELRLGMPLARGRGYDQLIEALEQTFASKKPSNPEIVWSDQRVFTALLTPLDGGGCVVLLHDISHFKTLEHVKDEFIATATHDLRNPLTSIKGYSQLIQHAGSLTEQQGEFIGRIQHSVTYMAELVENMLDLAKMDLGEEKKHEILNAALVVQELADEFKPQADAKNQSLTLVITESESMIRVNGLKIRRALRNLVGNAIKYTPDGGVITLSLEHEVDLVLIKIKDTGYGIPAEDLPHIFERFYRVRNKGHDEIEGNGLGLAIVKSIAEKYGGNVTVESEVDKGTCFTVFLPLLIQASPDLVVKDKMQEAIKQ